MVETRGAQSLRLDGYFQYTSDKIGTCEIQVRGGGNGKRRGTEWPLTRRSHSQLALA